MESHRKHKNVNAAITDGINQAMLVCDTTAPLAMLSFQRFRFTYAREGVLLNILQQIGNSFQNTFVASSFPVISVLFGLLEKHYFQMSSMDIGLKLPSAISLSPWRRISTIAGEDMIYFVSSITLFRRSCNVRKFSRVQRLI